MARVNKTDANQVSDTSAARRVGLIFLCGSRGVVESRRLSQIRGDGPAHPGESRKLCRIFADPRMSDKGRQGTRGTPFRPIKSAAQNQPEINVY